MITPESIERVREAADIVAIVGEHVKLRRTGSDFRGPCPFHNGKGPNFSVSPKASAYHCFVCHAKGDAIGFVRDHLGLDFVDAVKYVADRAGVVVEETFSARAAEERDAREPLWEVNAAAAELFRRTLWDEQQPEARQAREYLAGRGLGREEADRFGLGYATRDGRWLERLRAQGHDDARLLEVALLRQRDDGSAYAYFRGRLMIPIQDARGNVVGFGGRVIGDGEPKYLNSPQTTLFDKGRQLYGVPWARPAARKADRALVVEGYFDAARLALAGADETVAPLGTALTESQAELLAKLTKNVFLLYDSDEAGLKATFRAGLELLRRGVSPRVVTLPDGEDPDTFVRAHGKAGLEAQLAAAVDVFERQLQLLERRGWFAELHKARRAVDKLLPTLRAAADPLTRELYVARLAEVSRIERDVLAREVAAGERGSGRGSQGPRDGDAPNVSRRDARPGPEYDGPPLGGPNGGGRGAEVSPDGVEFVPIRAPRDDQFRFRYGDRRTGRFRRDQDWRSVNATPRVRLTEPVRLAERKLLRAMVQDRELVEVVAERWPPAEFHNVAYRELFGRLVDDPKVAVDEATSAFPPDAVAEIDQALSEPDPDPDTTVASWLVQLQVWAIDAEKVEVLRRLHSKDPPTPDAEVDALSARLLALQRERSALSPTFARVSPSRGKINSEHDRGRVGGTAGDGDG